MQEACSGVKLFDKCTQSFIKRGDQNIKSVAAMMDAIDEVRASDRYPALASVRRTATF